MPIEVECVVFGSKITVMLCTCIDWLPVRGSLFRTYEVDVIFFVGAGDSLPENILCKGLKPPCEWLSASGRFHLPLLRAGFTRPYDGCVFEGVRKDPCE